MTPERLRDAVAWLHREVAVRRGLDEVDTPELLLEAAAELEATAALRADLAKAKERIAALEVALYDVWGEDPATDPCSVCESEAGHAPDCIILTLPQVK